MEFKKKSTTSAAPVPAVRVPQSVLLTPLAAQTMQRRAAVWHDLQQHMSRPAGAQRQAVQPVLQAATLHTGVYRYAHSLPQQEYWEAFTGGYQTFRSLSDAELRAMPYFVILNMYWCMGFEAGTVIHSRGEALINDGYFTSTVAALRAWETQQLGQIP